MRVYIAGPMSGLPELNYPTFRRVTAALREMGHDVVSPHENFPPDPSLTREECLRVDFGYLVTCEAIAMLPGWEKSIGANHELSVAKMCGLEKYRVDLDVLGYPSCLVPLTEQKGKEDFDGNISGDGYKRSMDDPAKSPLTLVPPLFIRGIADVLKFGARKYARGQWMRGMSYSEVIDALKRHTEAIENGQDIDPDSGLPHEYHIGCCAAFLSWYRYGPRADEYRRFDDRLYAAEYRRRPSA